MSIARPHSIRQKLTLIVLATCGASILLACTVIAAYDIETLRGELLNQLVMLDRITGSNLTAALEFGDSESATEMLHSLRAEPHIVGACVYSTDGKLFAQYRREGRDSACAGSAPPAGHGGYSSGLVSAQEPIWLNNEVIGTILMKSDVGALHTRTARFVAIISVVSLLSFVAAYLLASRLQRVVSEPIVELAETATAISLEKDYSLRAMKRSDDEIGSLVDRFNEMVARVQEHEAALRFARDQLEARVNERTRELQNEIVERKQTERELEERKYFLDSLIENTPVGIVAIGPDHCIQMCNAAFENLFGYRQEELVGQSLPQLVAPEELRAEVAANAEALWAGRGTHLITKRKRRDGSVLDVEAFSVPLGPARHPTGGVLLYQDITERKRAEEALMRAKEAAEAANRAKSEFLANMSHEIRTPMNGIIGMTELTLDTPLTSEQREYLDMVKASAHSLLTVINDILDFSKIEAGKLDIDAVDFPLLRSLGEALKALAFRAHQKGLELAWSVGRDVPEFVTGDVGRLRQVLVNLVGNAVKFTERGEIVVSVEKETQDERGVTLHFQVRDTGIGIPKEKQQMIFDAFTQADSSASRKYGGTGLGLAITSRLVALMGGRIWVASDVGRGSTFHFTVRLGLAQDPEQQAPAAQPEVVRELPVLVVDDNDTNRKILVELLSRWGMRPTAAESGSTALSALVAAYAEGRPFGLVISDMHMPGMDGCALGQRIRNTPEFVKLPILMLSSTGQPGEAIRCRQVNISAYLAKPTQPSDLLDAILSLLAAPGAKPAESAQPSETAPEKIRLKRVLLVEDNAVNRKLATALLEKHGYSAATAQNGKEALEILEGERFDLILMDVQMPVMDGLEATRLIRAKERATGGHIPIVALTAHAMKGDRERCLAAGADDYVAKPIRIADVIAAMGRAFSSQRDASAQPSVEFGHAFDREPAL